jgi:hypothetical protein
MAAPLLLTTYRELKDKLIGPVGSVERAQFEQELAQELAALAVKTPRKPKMPRE